MIRKGFFNYLKILFPSGFVGVLAWLFATDAGLFDILVVGAFTTLLFVLFWKDWKKFSRWTEDNL